MFCSFIYLESYIYLACLFCRLSNKDFTKEQRQARVTTLLEELNISNVQNTQVGAPGLKRGISGGERKRVAIGTLLNLSIYLNQSIYPS